MEAIPLEYVSQPSIFLPHPALLLLFHDLLKSILAPRACEPIQCGETDRAIVIMKRRRIIKDKSRIPGISVGDEVYTSVGEKKVCFNINGRWFFRMLDPEWRAPGSSPPSILWIRAALSLPWRAHPSGAHRQKHSRIHGAVPLFHAWN